MNERLSKPAVLNMSVIREWFTINYRFVKGKGSIPVPVFEASI